MRRTSLLIGLVFLCAMAVTSRGALATPAAITWTAAGISWGQFEDPAEHAFAIAVPRGWKTVGGVYRFGPLDPRAMVDATSPDGKTNLRFGDAHVPPFCPLSQQMRAMGWREGRPYSPNGVAQEVVANYRPGWVFADLYGQSRFARSCGQLKLKAMHQLPPIHRNDQGRITAGDVLYTCDSPSGPKAAYVFAETSLTIMQSSGVWMVTWLYSFISPQEEAPEAMKAMLHSLGTFAINQQWEARQIQTNGAAGRAAYTQFEQNMAAEHQRFTQQQQQFQNQVDGFSRALRGQDLVINPVDGTQREVDIGTGGTHWINATGDVVNAPSLPGAGYQPMQKVP